ncbi:MAG: hypothetical protein IJD79_07130 [Clostridia bacterium]|nr:hypothetical protein [Clostridia bacterium]
MTFYRRLWIILIGLWYFIDATILGIISILTIIGIPFSKIWFGFAKLSFNPFEKEIDLNYSSHKFLNTLWLVTFGWFCALGFALSGIVFFVTLIFLPFGKPCFKIAKYFLAPFGADIS